MSNDWLNKNPKDYTIDDRVDRLEFKLATYDSQLEQVFLFYMKAFNHRLDLEDAEKAELNKIIDELKEKLKKYESEEK